MESPITSAMLSALRTSTELQDAARTHNWDDGFAIPLDIANHRLCDLAVALDLFWLAEAILWYQGEIEEDIYNGEWVAFSKLITSRILNDSYKVGTAEFRSEFGRVQRYKYLKSGVPALLLDNVVPGDAQQIGQGGLPESSSR